MFKFPLRHSDESQNLNPDPESPHHRGAGLTQIQNDKFFSIFVPIRVLYLYLIRVIRVLTRHKKKEPVFEALLTLPYSQSKCLQPINSSFCKNF
jgi:hypothetical protein